MWYIKAVLLSKKSSLFMWCAKKVPGASKSEILRTEMLRAMEMKDSNHHSKKILQMVINVAQHLQHVIRHGMYTCSLDMCLLNVEKNANSTRETAFGASALLPKFLLIANGSPALCNSHAAIPAVETIYVWLQSYSFWSAEVSSTEASSDVTCYYRDVHYTAP